MEGEKLRTRDTSNDVGPGKAINPLLASPVISSVNSALLIQIFCGNRVLLWDSSKEKRSLDA